LPNILAAETGIHTWKSLREIDAAGIEAIDVTLPYLPQDASPYYHCHNQRMDRMLQALMAAPMAQPALVGERRQARNLQEVAKLIGDLRNQPETLRARGRAALTTLAALPQVDANRMAAIGFCFGGSVVLELADGADLKAVVCFHGVLATTTPAVSGKVKASVLVCTGADDPLAPSEQVKAFEDEMRAADVRDWQVISYGNTLHGFTNPAADGSMMRAARYSAQADRRAWASMRSLFDEVFGDDVRRA
jgi:dienelactone hydrolase